MELTRDGGLTNDVVVANANLTYGGTLKVVVSGSIPLSVNDTFKLFAFSSTPAGNFVLNLPAEYTWDTSQLAVDGTIKVTGVTARPQPGFNIVTVSGGSIVMSGTNAVGTYVLLSSTNIALPVANWTREQTNTYSGSFSITNAIDAPQKFYLLQ
jgi:hypothetical protein